MAIIFQCTYTLDTIENAARQFWNELHTAGKIFAFSGEMGAGKTTLIHKICDHIGVEDTVSSPTFALINEYHFADSHSADNTIFHMDWYRLKNSAEAINTGMDDCLAQAQRGAAWCFVEWPEKAKELFTPPYIWVSIESTAPGERRLSASLIKQ